MNVFDVLSSPFPIQSCPAVLLSHSRLLAFKSVTIVHKTSTNGTRAETILHHFGHITSRRRGNPCSKRRRDSSFLPRKGPAARSVRILCSDVWSILLEHVQFVCRDVVSKTVLLPRALMSP